MQAIRSHLSYANVIATVALFLALGGTAWALSKNSVGTKQLKNNAVTGKKIKNGAVTRRKIAASAQQALKGQQGAPGTALGYAHVLQNGTLDTANSKNVASAYESSPGSGRYCLNFSVPFKNVVGSGDYSATESVIGPDVDPGDIAVDCTSGPANVIVYVFSGPNLTTLTPDPFYIIFN
jgi:hypothetical protein